MSTFSKLKQQRKDKENKSYTGKSSKKDVQSSSSAMDVDPAEPVRVEGELGPTRQTSYHSEGLYESLPRDLEIRVHTDETGKGRGIYTLRQRKPGKSPV
jgi:hypothetical protein